MKAHRCILVLLFSSLLFAQAAPQAPTKPGTPEPATKQPSHTPPASAAPASKPVPEAAAVITIPHICENPAAKAADCKLVVTRAQFEKLVTALTGGRESPQQVPPQLRRQFATQYARLLTFATEAEKQGLDKRPESLELLRFARLQALAQEFTHVLQDQAKPAAEEVQKFYDNNRTRFQEVTLQRIMLPKKPATEGTAPADLKKVAEDLRQRAASGADFKTLQGEAFAKVGMQNPPETKLVTKPEAIPPSQRSVLQLKPGEVSQVIDEVGGFYIYKFDGQQQIPLDQVRGQIESALSQEKMQQEMENLLKPATPDLNVDYFGAAPPAGNGIGVLPGAPPQR